MATDSFCLKSGIITQVDSNGTQTGRNGQGIPYIYHPGAVTAALDLLPAVSEMNGTVLSEVQVFKTTILIIIKELVKAKPKSRAPDYIK